MNLANRLPEQTRIILRQDLDNQLESSRNVRLSWWAHWAQLAEMFDPRKYRWFITPNQMNRGSPINQSIVDETGVLAARTCASGMLAGMTSPTKPWYRFGIHGMPDMSVGRIRVWLATCETITAKVLSESNFYQSIGDNYRQNCIFGSAPIIIYEDEEDLVRFYNPCMGEFFYVLDNTNRVTGLFREYTYTNRQCYDEFENDCPDTIIQAVASGGSNLDNEQVVRHAILPNKPFKSLGKNYGYVVPKSFPYYEVYWIQSDSDKFIVRLKGFKEKPFVGARWDVTSNDPYGRSPGMDALPATRQLQIEQRRKAEAIDKMVRPPMVGSVGMKNEPANCLPGGITYTIDPQAEGFKPAFQVEPRIQEMMEDLKEVQDRVEKTFFVPLFMMISSLDTVRTATEIDARKEEQLIQLGPVIERMENEVLDDLLSRVFSILARKGMFPPPPPEIAGKEINITYISAFAQTQRAASTAGIERLFQFAGGIAGIQPEIMDNLDADDAIEEYADLLGVSPKIIRALSDVIKIRQQRNQQQQQQAALQSAQAAAQGAQTLSQTNVGGGKNALETMLNG